MPQATAPGAERERLEIIWRTITRDVQRYANDSGIAPVNSERWLRIDNTLEELAAMLADGLSGQNRGDGDDEFNEMGELMCIQEEIWQVIETKLIAFAMDVETRRAARREGKAA